MKTTLEIPEELFLRAKAVAARRRTTLKAIVEHALRRELREPQDEAPDATSRIERNELGFLVLRRGPVETVSTETVKRIQDGMDAEELARALAPAGVR